VGKHHINVTVRFGPGTAKKRRCFACHRPIVYGDRCPDCVSQARAQAINRKRRKRKRKPR
jgi:hypothetical protein